MKYFVKYNEWVGSIARHLEHRTIFKTTDDIEDWWIGFEEGHKNEVALVDIVVL